MRKIVIGLVIFCIKLNINIGSTTIALIPDFIGFLMIVEGIREIPFGKGAFSKTKQIATIMFYYSVFAFVYQLAANGLGEESLDYVISGVGSIGYFYMTWHIAKAILKIQQTEEIDLPHKILERAWMFCVLFHVCSMISKFAGDTMYLLGIISIIGGLMSKISYIGLINDCKNIIEDMSKSQDE